jgi:hypothetical protein
MAAPLNNVDVGALLGAFNALNAGAGDFMSVGDLPVNRALRTEGYERISTQFGQKVKCVVYLDNVTSATIILPERFNALSDDQLQGYNTLVLTGHCPMLTYRGRKGSKGAFNLELSIVS